MKCFAPVLLMCLCVLGTEAIADTNEGVARASAQAELVLPPHPAQSAQPQTVPPEIMPPTAVYSQSYVIDPYVRPYMGVQIRDVGAQLADYFGVEGGILVESVDTNGPAYRSEVRAGDIIVSFSGEDVRSTEGLFRRLDGLKAGDAVDLGIVRRGTSHLRKLTLAERPPTPEGFAVPRELEDAVGHVNVVFGNQGAEDVNRILESIRRHTPSTQAQTEEFRRIMVDELRRQVDVFRREIEELRKEVRSALPSPDAPAPRTIE